MGISPKSWIFSFSLKIRLSGNTIFIPKISYSRTDLLWMGHVPSRSPETTIPYPESRTDAED